jgi:hypothetical protein
MPNKNQILQDITTLAEQKLITKDEIDDAYQKGIHTNIDPLLTKKLGVSEIISYVGGAIVFLGIAILLGQNWSTLSFATKMIVTMGSATASYIGGVLLSKNEKTEVPGMVFHFLAALVFPLGLYVFFNNSGFDANTAWMQSVISLILFALYGLSYLVFRKSVFIFFAIIFATWLFFAFSSFMFPDTYPNDFMWKFYEYRILFTGTVYMLLGFVFSKGRHAPLQGFLYGFGVLSFLGAAFSLGGWSPTQSLFWELIYPFLVFGALFLSVRLKSSAFLVCGSIFLMTYILKITAEYFF